MWFTVHPINRHVKTHQLQIQHYFNLNNEEGQNNKSMSNLKHQSQQYNELEYGKS
jgi:hypothetical protein